MPQRFLRPGLTTSKRFNRCDWFTQSLYIRLITLVDDFARFEADPELLSSLAFPYGDPAGNRCQPTALVVSLRALADADLLTLYASGGKQYLQLTRWQERVRSGSSKYPPPDNICCQVLSNDSKCSPPKPSPSPSPEPSSSPLVRSREGDSPSFSETAGELGITSGTPTTAADTDPNGITKRAAEVLSFLNTTTGKQFDAVPSILDLIKHRLREGATVEDCQFAIRHCHADWHKDARMSAYVRPSTIFGDKFHEYKEAGRRRYARRAEAQKPKTFRTEIERLEHEFVSIRDKVDAAREEATWTGNSFREQRAKLAKAFLVTGEPALVAAQQALEAAMGGDTKPEAKA